MVNEDLVVPTKGRKKTKIPQKLNLEETIVKQEAQEEMEDKMAENSVKMIEERLEEVFLVEEEEAGHSQTNRDHRQRLSKMLHQTNLKFLQHLQMTSRTRSRHGVTLL